jgi:hypothetical protein
MIERNNAVLAVHTSSAKDPTITTMEDLLPSLSSEDENNAIDNGDDDDDSVEEEEEVIDVEFGGILVCRRRRSGFV